SGKTCLSYLTAFSSEWGVFELNASDFRSKEVIERIVSAAALNSSFSGKKRLVLLDEVDGLQSQDRGGAGAIVSILKESKNPVILTANDIYADKKLAPIRVACRVLEFRKINYLSIAKRLKEILSMEKIEFEEEAIKELAKNSGGDFRSSLLDVQTLSMSGKISVASVSGFGERMRAEKIFSVMAKIFKGKTIQEIREAVFSSDVSNDLLLRWVEENIPRQYSGEDVALAFEVFSRADRFNGRIMRRQHYGFLRYASDLMTVGVNLSKQKEYNSFIPFQFPTILSKLSKSASVRQLMEGIAQKISKKTHSSIRQVLSSDFAFIKMNFENRQKAVELTAQFGFDEEEVAFLLDTSPGTKKVSSVVEDSNALLQKSVLEKFVQSKPVQKEASTVQTNEIAGEQTTLFLGL
ncbi:MAG: replication factor C large subunit, partial [Candidatus Diapherotrites archaeon]|nr:replication factor C large subunit [Candidatus Diapherotrites archaeon]